MSDIFDLFGDPEEPPKNPSDNSETTRAGELTRTDQARAGLVAPRRETAPIRGSGQFADPAQALAGAVAELGFGDAGFLQEPDLAAVAFAVADLLEQAGFGAEAIAAERWAAYEASGRRSSKIEEARARADAVYRADLEAIQGGWKPIHKTGQSTLPWRRPEEPEKEWLKPSGASDVTGTGSTRTTPGGE